MKLAILAESVDTKLIAYHVTESDHIPEIQKYGLRANSQTKYDHVGKGIYIFFDEKAADHVAEYIGLMDPVLITLQVNENDLLMDEDSLMAHEESDRILRRVLSQEAFEEYMQFLETNGGDTESINDRDVAIFKTDFVDRYQLKPHKLLPVRWGHYAVLTARLTSNKPQIINIEPLDL